MPEHLRCNACGKSVSTPVPSGIIVRAWVECPECVEAGIADEAMQPTPEVESIVDEVRETHVQRQVRLHAERRRDDALGHPAVVEAIAAERGRAQAAEQKVRRLMSDLTAHPVVVSQMWERAVEAEDRAATLEAALRSMPCVGGCTDPQVCDPDPCPRCEALSGDVHPSPPCGRCTTGRVDVAHSRDCPVRIQERRLRHAALDAPEVRDDAL